MPHELIKALISFQAAVIFFVWVFFSQLAGLIILAAAIAVTLVTAWSISDYSISLEIVLFCSIAVVANILRLKIQAQFRQAYVRIEEIQKNRNVLMEAVESHKGVQEALKKKLHRFFQLKELISKLSARLDVEGTADIVTTAAFNIISKADSCYFYIVDTDKQQLALIAAKQRLSGPRMKNKTGDMFDLWTFKQRQPLLIRDIRKDYRFDLAKAVDNSQQNNFKSLISAPLICEEKVTALIRMNHSRANVFLPDDLRLLDIISSIAGVSLENAFLYNRTKELAVRDGVTGAYVQKFFKERLAEEIIRSLRNNSSVSVLLLDIDFFKAYNDKYGHTAGDIVLKKVAVMISAAVGEAGDIVARYGGEEFGVILVNQDKKQAVITAENIRKKIESEVFILRREKTSVTISIGVASCPGDSKICEDILKSADDALYKAKKAGRNCVVSI